MPKKDKITEVVDERLASLMAAALADPDVDAASKSLAGFLLERITAQRDAKEVVP